MARYSVLIGEEAKQEFLLIPFPIRRQVNQRINKLKVDPRLEGSEAIAGSDRFRLEAAGWRILYEVDDTARVITIVAFRSVEATPRG